MEFSSEKAHEKEKTEVGEWVGKGPSVPEPDWRRGLDMEPALQGAVRVCIHERPAAGHEHNRTERHTETEAERRGKETQREGDRGKDGGNQRVTGTQRETETQRERKGCTETQRRQSGSGVEDRGRQGYTEGERHTHKDRNKGVYTCVCGGWGVGSEPHQTPKWRPANFSQSNTAWGVSCARVGDPRDGPKHPGPRGESPQEECWALLCRP